MRMDDPRHWLTLYHAPKLSAHAARQCIEHFGSVKAVCTASFADLQAVGLSDETVRFIHAPNNTNLKQDLNWAEQPGHHVLFDTADTYPAKLREIKDPPLLIFGIGDMSLLNAPQIAIVGSRQPTPGGLRNARMFSQALATAGFIITSGLAVGVDTCAHTTTLAAKAPTIAVIGTGMNVVYPAKNKALARDIAESGAIISEFSCTMPAYAQNFPRRNRLMSGLSNGVLVIEAAERSGSLITARLAAEQGREVFALPGSIHNPLARGCHHLIQNGAKLVQTIDDILIEFVANIDLSPDLLPNNQTNNTLHPTKKDKLTTEQKQLLKIMGFDEPVTIDMLVEVSGLPAESIASMLLILELDGYVGSENHTYVRLI